MAEIPATPGLIGHYPLLKVDVVIGKGRRSQRVTAMVDSGADRTVVPRLVAEALGVDYNSLKKPVGPDGEVLKGQGADGEFEIRVCRGKVRWRMTKICDEFWVADCGMVLLGRDDFFALFDVMFNWSAANPYMVIEPAGTLSASSK